MNACNPERVEQYLFGELPPSAALDVEHHVQGCASCRDELEWLRAERAAFAQHPFRELSPPPLAVIEGRLLNEQRVVWARRLAWGACAAAGLAAAWWLVLARTEGVPSPGPDGTRPAAPYVAAITSVSFHHGRSRLRIARRQYR